jgi:hypothetical protein
LRKSDPGELVLAALNHAVQSTKIRRDTPLIRNRWRIQTTLAPP